MKTIAYKEAKLQYRKLMEFGMAVSLLFAVLLFQGSKRLEFEKRNVIINLPTITQLDAIATTQDPPKADIKKPWIPVATEDIDFVGENNTDKIFEGWAISLNPPPDPFENENINPGDFIVVQKQAEPIGGFAAIAQHLEYPEVARKARIEGRSVIWAKIDKKGNVVETRVQKSLGFEPCDEAARKAIEAVKWDPALQRDQPVSVWVSVPVDFRLR